MRPLRNRPRGTMAPMAHDLIWYVGYGSNMSAGRLRCYIEGGRAPGGRVEHVGARDRTPPVRDTAVTLPGRVYFAGESRTWGGGMAFYDHDASGPTPARAFLITVGQFVDIAAQEMHRPPRPGDPLEHIVLDGLPDGRHAAGPGHYETVVAVGRLDGRPMFTLTAPHGMDAVAHTPPGEAYLSTLAAGLREAHGWDRARCDRYFASRTSPAC